jgi:hypothetical protein
VVPYIILIEVEPAESGTKGVNGDGDAPLFPVISVTPAVRFAVVQETDELHVDAPLAIVQLVALIVPEGPATGSQVSPSQVLPGRQVTSTPGVKES